MAVSAVFSTSALAQASAFESTSSTATAITPITIANSVDLAFGTFAVTALAGGTITVAPDASSTVTTTGAVTITTITTPTAALFTVSGETGYTYDLSLDVTTFDLLGAATTGAETLTITDVQTSLGGLEGTLTEGSDIVYVGGTLTIPLNTAKDVYTNDAAFVVTVDYN